MDDWRQGNWQELDSGWESETVERKTELTKAGVSAEIAGPVLVHWLGSTAHWVLSLIEQWTCKDKFTKKLHNFILSFYQYKSLNQMHTKIQLSLSLTLNKTGKGEDTNPIKFGREVIICCDWLDWVCCCCTNWIPAFWLARGTGPVVLVRMKLGCDVVMELFCEAMTGSEEEAVITSSIPCCRTEAVVWFVSWFSEEEMNSSAQLKSEVPCNNSFIWMWWLSYLEEKHFKLHMLNALVEIARCGSLNFFFYFSALLIFKFFNCNLNSDLLDHCHFQKILHWNQRRKIKIRKFYCTLE